VKATLLLHPNKIIESYTLLITKFMDQIARRLLNGETIAAEEKIYSIFEQYTEWLNKGKRNVELGNSILLTTNQYHLIMDYKIMYKEKDAAQIVPLIDRLQTNYADYEIASLSTDKGFYSKENYQYCVDAGVKNVVMPKKGKPNKIEYEREHTKEFVSLRNKHSGIESNINMLEHHGLNRCPDRGTAHYERYIATSILACNLHQIGNAIVNKQRKKEERAAKKLKLKKAA
jgi:transposase, IS5 family